MFEMLLRIPGHFSDNLAFFGNVFFPATVFLFKGKLKPFLQSGDEDIIVFASAKQFLTCQRGTTLKIL